MTAVAKLPEKWREDDDCSALEYAERLRCADELEAALSPAELGGVVSALAVFRIAGGDTECCPNPSAEMALGCLNDLRECYDEALSTPRAAEAVTEYRWRSVSDDLPERTGWYIGINYGVVEPLRWDGNNWHHTRVTRDLAMPSHWRPLPAPPSAKGEL